MSCGLCSEGMGLPTAIIGQRVGSVGPVDASGGGEHQRRESSVIADRRRSDLVHRDGLPV